MRRNLALLSAALVLCVFPWNEPAFASDTNVKNKLNRLLRQQPKVIRTKTIEVEKSFCTHHNIPPMANGGTTEDCSDYVERVTKRYRTYATVEKTEVVEVRDLKMLYAEVVELPSEPLLYRTDFENCAENVSMSTTLSLSVTGQKGFSVSKTRGLSTTIGGSVGMSASYMGVGVNTSFNMSQTVSLSSSVNESESESETRSKSWTISVPPKTIGYAQILAYQQAVEIPFRAVVVVDGVLAKNRSGFSKASDILSAEARTLPFEGTLRIDNVSVDRVSTHNLPGMPSCEHADGKDVLTVSSAEVPASEGDFDATEFVDFRTFMEGPSAFTGEAAFSGSTIGPADGITYQVMSTTEIMKPAFECGYNDFSIPNPGIFNSEVRQYYEHSAGMLLRTWPETKDTFLRCHPI